MILRLQPRLWPCRRFDHAIIVRTLDTSSVKGKEEKPPSSRTYDLRVKLRASEGKNCDEQKQCDNRLSQEDIEAKVEVTSARVDRIVKRDRKLSLMKRLKKIDRVGQQDQYNPDLIFKNDTGQIEPHLRQDNSKGIPEENLMEHLPQRVLTPVTMRIPEGLEKTIEVFRDFPDQYPFLRFEVPSVAESPVSPHFWLSFASLTKDKQDVLKAWKLASSSQDAVLQQEVVLRLQKNLPNYSYSELASITYNLSLLKRAPDQLAELTSLLDHHLTERMREMMAEPEVEQIEECLRVAFMWLRMKMQLRVALGTLGGHNWALLNLLLTRHLHQLGPRHLVAALVVVGVHRTLPFRTRNSALPNNTGSPLPASLDRALVTSLPFLDHREVGVVCHALHRCGLYLETGHSELRKLLLRSLTSFPDTFVLRHQFAVGSIAKFLKRRGSESHSAVVAAISKYQPHLRHMDTFTRVRLLQFVTTGFCAPEETLAFVEEFCAASKPELASMRIKDLEKMAFCLYYLNHEQVNVEYAPLIAEAVQKCSWNGVKAGLSFVYLTSLLTKLGCKEMEESIDQVLEAANSMESIGNLDTDKGLADAVQFLIKLNIPAHQQVSQQDMLQLVKRNRARQRNSLLQLLDIDSMREIQKLKVTTSLRPELRDKIADYFHAGDQGVLVADLVDKRGQIKPADFTDETKNFVHRDLVTLLRGESMVWRGHAFPHSTKPDLFLLYDRKRRRPLPFPPDFHCYGKGGEGILNATQLERVAGEKGGSSVELHVVVTLGKHDQHFWGHPHGPLAFKLRQLRLLGHRYYLIHKYHNYHDQCLSFDVAINCRPLLVPWASYYSAMRNKENLSFLRKLLNLPNI